MSAELGGQRVDLAAITDNDAAPGSGVPDAELLLAFTDALVGDDDAMLEAARDALTAKCGAEVLVETAATVANFQRMVRVADSTGIPLDTGMSSFTTDLRAELGLNDFASAANTPAEQLEGTALGKLVGLGIRGVMKGVGFVRGATACFPAREQRSR